MAESTNNSSAGRKGLSVRLGKAWEPFTKVPLLGWLLGILVAVALEQLVGTPLAHLVGLSKIPVLFGFVIVLKQPVLLPGTLLYILLIYLLPVGLVARLGAALTNKLAARLLQSPLWVSAIVHVGLLYASLHMWADISDYRDLVLRLTLIAIILTLSLNIVNGYMGEFSCSHPGFMALGAYAASAFTVIFFVEDKVFGSPLLPPALGPFLFPLALIFGGVISALGALLVAIPSFRTRGDYLAIISLAFLFIVKSLIENLEILGGPRGFMSQPDWANLPTVFIWCMGSIWIINNFVSSTLGKSLNAVRDEETAANAMTVNTRRTKMVGFQFAAFWAGVAGGLFAHVMRYVNPGSFGIQKLAEMLAMVYFGGLNSVVGSIVGAVGFNLLSEALRPLELFKWIIIPLLLILVMLYRPTGLIAFREFDIANLLKPKRKSEEEVEHAIATD
ncbi:MAG: branched-chain amino acid ABC transporter permease [Anaerolineales bacterium]|nr:branched-chain amino acid ABC transporter permease [Anaerolineales bacterium]